MMATRLRRQLLMAVGLLVAMQLATSLVAIALLTRMGPSVARVLEQNVYSIEAVESMLEALATAGQRRGQARRQFEQSLLRAKANVTEPAESELVATLERLGTDAIRGDAVARVEATHALRRLGSVNRDAVRRADDEARRLGRAGAWAGVFLGLAGVALGLLLFREARRQVLGPLEQLHAVARAHRDGERHRRARVPAASPELAEIMVAFNRLLDAQRHSGARNADGDTGQLLRASLLALLDQRPDPVAVLDARGTLVVANQPALSLLASDQGERVRAALREVAAAVREEDRPYPATVVGDRTAFICCLSAPRASV
jgi:PAS domain-containing protein